MYELKVTGNTFDELLNNLLAAGVTLGRKVQAAQAATPAPAAVLETTAPKLTAAQKKAAEAAAAKAAKAAPEPEPEVAAQDAADEADELDMSDGDETPATPEDVRAIMNSYVVAFGMPAAKEDVRKLWSAAGISALKVSDVKPDQLTLARDAIKSALEVNPYNRAKVSA